VEITEKIHLNAQDFAHFLSNLRLPDCGAVELKKSLQWYFQGNYSKI